MLLNWHIVTFLIKLSWTNFTQINNNMYICSEISDLFNNFIMAHKEAMTIKAAAKLYDNFQFFY